MIDVIRKFLIDVINSTYLLIMGTVEYLGFLDSPGTYLIVMVIGFVIVPFSAKGIYHQYVNPHMYEHKSLLRRVVINVSIILVIVLFGYLNFIRFLPAS
jgi:hypothetical protein